MQIPEGEFKPISIIPTIPVCRDIRTRWKDSRKSDLPRFFYVLNGGFILNDNTQSYIVRKNQMVLLPAGNVHAYWRLPNVPLSLLMFRFRAEYEGEDYFVHNGLTEGNLIVNLPREDVVRCFRQMTEPAVKTDPFTAHLRLCAYTAELCSLYADARFSSDSALHYYRDVIDFMHAHKTTELSLDALAATFDVDPTYFVKIFKKRMGISPMRFFGQIRAQHAAQILKTTNLTIPEVARQVGFSDFYYFKTFFARHMGVKPETYRDMIIGLRDEQPAAD